MESRNKKIIDLAPRFSWISSSVLASGPVLTARLTMAAGMTRLIRDGMNSVKNPRKETMPFCQTIRVVISPNGLNAPPALTATRQSRLWADLNDCYERYTTTSRRCDLNLVLVQQNCISSNNSPTPRNIRPRLPSLAQ